MMRRKKKIKALRISQYRLLVRGQLILKSLPLLTHSRLIAPELSRLNAILPRINKKRGLNALTPHHRLRRDKVTHHTKLLHTNLLHHALYRPHHNIVHQANHQQIINHPKIDKHHSVHHHASHRTLQAIHQHHAKLHHSKYHSQTDINSQNITHKNVMHHHMNKNMIKLIKNISAHDGGIKAVKQRLIQQITPLATQAKQAHQSQSAVKANHTNHTNNAKSKAETTASQLDYGQIRQMMRDEMAQMARQLQHVIQSETRNDFLETSRIRALTIR